MFKIGEFSKLAHISIRMLRHYDELELLTPQTVDSITGYRHYSAQQLQRVNQIQRLKELGFNLGLIKKMVDPDTDITKLANYFNVREKELKEEQDKIEKQKNLLESTTIILRKGRDQMNYHVIHKAIPERKVISIRQVVPNYMSEGLLWQKLYEEIGKQNVSIAPIAYGMAIFHDSEYKETDVDIEVQVTISGKYQDSEEIHFKTALKTEIASVTFHGGYEQMPKITETVAQWIEDNKLKLNGPMFNIYHISPAQDPNPENWVTEACFPITKM